MPSLAQAFRAEFSFCEVAKEFCRFAGGCKSLNERATISLVAASSDHASRVRDRLDGGPARTLQAGLALSNSGPAYRAAGPPRSWSVAPGREASPVVAVISHRFCGFYLLPVEIFAA